MNRLLFLIFILFVFVVPVNADPRIDITLASYQNCPTIEKLVENKQWIEHSDSEQIIQISEQLKKHFSFPLISVKPNIAMRLVNVIVDRGMGKAQWGEIIWIIHRTPYTNFSGKNMTCYIMGSIAFYVEVQNVNGWPPKVKFTSDSSNEWELLKNSTIGLIELRWFNSVEEKKHRWFNRKLATKMQWVKDKNYSPIDLPRAVNVLD